MSAYSDWKCGALSDDEYRSIARRENAEIDHYDRFTCRDCGSYKDCKKQVCLIGVPQCDEYENCDVFEDEWEVYEAFQDKKFLEANYGCIDTEAILRDFETDSIRHDYKNWCER